MIRNLLEQELFHFTMQSENKNIDISDLTSGVYIVDVTTENKIQRQKFIKQ